MARDQRCCGAIIWPVTVAVLASFDQYPLLYNIAGKLGRSSNVGRGCRFSWDNWLHAKRLHDSFLDIQTSHAGEELQIVFDHVDPQDHRREFAFAVKIQKGKKYAGTVLSWHIDLVHA